MKKQALTFLFVLLPLLSPGFTLAQSHTIGDAADLAAAMGNASAKTIVFNQSNVTTGDDVTFAGTWRFDTSGFQSGTTMLNAPKITLTGATLDVTGTAIQSIQPNQRTFTILEAANGGLHDRFLNVHWGDTIQPYDFLDLRVARNPVSADTTQVTVTQELRWYRGVTSANGTFTLAAGEAFDVGVELADQKRNIIVGDLITEGDLTHGWDGRSLTKAGEGTLTLSAVNTYSGTTAVEKGVLRLGATDAIAASSGVDVAGGATLDAGQFDQTIRGLTGAGSVTVQDTHTLTVDTAENTEFAGSFGGTGNLVKRGAGTWTLSGNSVTPDSPKNIRVEQGRLVVNGQFQTHFEIMNNAALGGIGSQRSGFDFRSGSYHAPGNSIDTFRADSINYDGGSTIFIEVGQDASGNIIADRVITSNGLAFGKGGGTTTVHFINFEETLREKSDTGFDLQVFLNENGDIMLGDETLASIYAAAGSGDTTGLKDSTGHSELVFKADPSLNVESSELDNNSMIGQSLYVRLTPTGLVTPLSGNQLAVLRSLQGGSALQAAIFSLSGDERRQALNQVMPILDSASPLVARRAIVRYNDAAFQRLEHLGVHGRTGCAPKLHQLWGLIDGDLTEQKNDNEQDLPGYRLESGGLVAGWDNMILSDLIVGVSVGGTETKSKLKNGLSSGRTNMFQASLYAMWLSTNNWSLKTSVGYQWSEYTLDRSIPLVGENAHSKHHGNSVFAAAELSKRFRFGQTLLVPYLKFDFVNLWEDAYTEENAPISGLRVDKRTTQAYLQTVGFRIERNFFFNNGSVLRPEIYGAWIHDYGDGRIHTVATLPGQATFDMTGMSSVPDRALLGIGLNLSPWENWVFYGRYEVETADDFSAQIGQIGLGFLW